MASLLGRLFGWNRPIAPGKSRSATPRPAARPESDFTYGDTSTWTFPHQSVSSSNIASIAYDADEEVLEIRFKEASRNHSSTYRYSSVPLSVYEGLMLASSKGEFHWQNIRDRFVYSDVG